MQRSIYLALFLFISVSMTGPLELKTAIDNQQESLLKQAAAIITSSKYASYPQYDHTDYTTTFSEVEGMPELSVRMNQVSYKPSGRFYFSSLTAMLAIVAVEWEQGYNHNYVYDYTLIFQKRGDEWVSITEPSYLTGHIEKLIDLDGDGSDELILKESTINKENNDSGGKYRLAFLNVTGKYETYWHTHLGYYFRHQDGDAVSISTVNLDYVMPNDQMIVVSTVTAGPDSEQVTGRFTWNGSELELYNPEKRTHLIIEGKDIWVRDAPATGKVVMKLNQGDQCRILGKTGFEIIRGMADWWYHIEFEGQKGWVFGSQTDAKHFVQLVDEYVDVWEFYSKGLMDECREHAAEGFFSDVPDAGCEYKEISNNSFVITHNNEDGSISEQHKLRKILKNELALVTVRREIGAAMFSTHYLTRAACYTKSAWNMRLSTELNGELDTLYRIADGKYLIITKTNDFLGPEFGLNGMQSWTKWNVYLFDNSKGSPFQELQELGEFEFSSDMITYAKEGEVFTDSLGIDYNFDTPGISLVLKEYKRKTYGDTFVRMPDLTGESTYYWDEQAMKFIQQ